MKVWPCYSILNSHLQWPPVTLRIKNKLLRMASRAINDLTLLSFPNSFPSAFFFLAKLNNFTVTQYSLYHFYIAILLPIISPPSGRLLFYLKSLFFVQTRVKHLSIKQSSHSSKQGWWFSPLWISWVELTIRFHLTILAPPRNIVVSCLWVSFHVLPHCP